MNLGVQVFSWVVLLLDVIMVCCVCGKLVVLHEENVIVVVAFASNGTSCAYIHAVQQWPRFKSNITAARFRFQSQNNARVALIALEGNRTDTYAYGLCKTGTAVRHPSGSCIYDLSYELPEPRKARTTRR